MNLSIPERLKGKEKSINVLIGYNTANQEYILYDLQGKVIKTFQVPLTGNKKKRTNISFSIVAPSVIYEDQSGIVYNYDTEEITTRDKPHNMLFTLGDGSNECKGNVVLHKEYVPIIWNIDTKEDKELPNYLPILYIKSSKEIIYISEKDDNFITYHRINIDTMKSEPLFDSEILPRVSRILYSYDELIFYKNDTENQELKILDPVTFKENRRIQTEFARIDGIIKISSSPVKYIVLGNTTLNNRKHVSVYVLNSDGIINSISCKGGIKLFPIYDSQLINTPNLCKFGVLYKSIDKQLWLYDYKDADNRKKVDRTIIEFPNTNTVLFHSFYLEEEREIAKGLIKYMPRPLTQIVRKFII